MTQAGQLSFLESSTGTVTISNTGSGALNIAGGIVAAGQISGGGTRTTSSSTPPANPGVGDLWYNTLTDTIARYTTDGTTFAWLDITGPTITNAFSGGTITQSIIPSATASYDLGSPSYRFRTLYVTSSTIDIGGVPLSVAGGNLQVAGATVGAASSGTTSAFAITNNTATTGTASGALVVAGGVGIGGDLYIGGTITAQQLTIQYTTVTQTQVTSPDIFTIINTTVSSNTTTGALTVAGGAGIGGNLNVGGTGTFNAIFGNSITATSITATSITATSTISANTLSVTTVGTIGGAVILTTATIGTYANLGIPQNSQSAAYTTIASDAGWCIFHPASDANARTFTIAANASVPYALGTVIQFINMSTQAVTIAINSDTLTWAQGGASGSRTLAQYGVANCIKIATTQWLLTGTNVT